MPQFVVLLRGVNVGKGNRVPMAALRSLLEAEGFSEVATLLNSGNAVFRSAGGTAATHAKAIRARLERELGVSVLVVVKSAAGFLAAVSQNPFVVPEEHHSRFLVAFAHGAAGTRALSALAPVVEPPEKLHVGTHAAYVYCARGILDSTLGSAVLGNAGRELTTRNWATVLKLRSMLGPMSPDVSSPRSARRMSPVHPAAKEHHEA